MIAKRFFKNAEAGQIFIEKGNKWRITRITSRHNPFSGEEIKQVYLIRKDRLTRPITITIYVECNEFGDIDEDDLSFVESLLPI